MGRGIETNKDKYISEKLKKKKKKSLTQELTQLSVKFWFRYISYKHFCRWAFSKYK